MLILPPFRFLTFPLFIYTFDTLNASIFAVLKFHSSPRKLLVHLSLHVSQVKHINDAAVVGLDAYGATAGRLR
jgi:hypothetical protein